MPPLAESGCPCTMHQSSSALASPKTKKTTTQELSKRDCPFNKSRLQNRAKQQDVAGSTAVSGWSRGPASSRWSYLASRMNTLSAAEKTVASAWAYLSGSHPMTLGPLEEGLWRPGLPSPQSGPMGSHQDWQQQALGCQPLLAHANDSKEQHQPCEGVLQSQAYICILLMPQNLWTLLFDEADSLRAAMPVIHCKEMSFRINCILHLDAAAHFYTPAMLVVSPACITNARSQEILFREKGNASHGSTAS